MHLDVYEIQQNCCCCGNRWAVLFSYLTWCCCRVHCIWWKVVIYCTWFLLLLTCNFGIYFTWWLFYCHRLFVMLRRFPIESRGRQKKLHEVTSLISNYLSGFTSLNEISICTLLWVFLQVGFVTGICCTCFLIRCVMVSLHSTYIIHIKYKPKFPLFIILFMK